MSNDAHLYATLERAASNAPHEGARLLWIGPYMLPALWLGAFRRSDLVTIVRDGREASQLFAPKPRALSSLRAFLSGLRSSRKAADTLGPILTSFEEGVVNIPGEGLQLDDDDLQCLVGLEAHKAWLLGCLAFVEDVAEGRLSGDAIFASPGALELFDQAQVDLNSWSTEIGWEASLRGYRP